jgi:hypothetical protein
MLKDISEERSIKFGSIIVMKILRLATIRHGATEESEINHSTRINFFFPTMYCFGHE